MGKVSLTPSWLHKASAFAVVVAGSAVAWPWQDVVSVSTAGFIVSLLGAGKLVVEFLTGNEPAQSA